MTGRSKCGNPTAAIHRSSLPLNFESWGLKIFRRHTFPVTCPTCFETFEINRLKSTKLGVGNVDIRCVMRDALPA
jgi:hypothetical protein